MSRLSPPDELEPLLDDLSEKGVFATKQKGMMFAAAVGYAADVFAEIDKRGEGIRLEYFRKKNDVGFIDALAVAHSKDLEILVEERKEERIEIFERYAAGGLAEIRTRLKKEKARSALDVIVGMIDELNEPKGEKARQLARLL